MLDRIASLLLILALVSSCATLAACGSGKSRLSAGEYRERLRALSRREARAHTRLAGAINASSAAQIRRLVSDFAADQQAVAGQVSSLEPPRNAEEANHQLARGFRDAASETRRLSSELATARTPKAALALVMEKGPRRGDQEVDAALIRLRKLGYAKGG